MSRVGDARQRVRGEIGRRLRAFLRGSGPTPEAIRRADFHRSFPVGPGDVVFLGDSITEGAEWNELFPGISTRNRGIAEETTADVLARLDSVLVGAPAKLFIQVGINDILFGGSDDDFVRNYRSILRRCRAESPSTVVYVQTLLPGSPDIGGRIVELNRRLADLAEEFGVTLVTLDELGGHDATMPPEISPDSLHLTGEGYRMWRDVLAPFVED